MLRIGTRPKATANDKAKGIRRAQYRQAIRRDLEL